MTGAEYLAEFLIRHEVRHVFHVPAILRRTLVHLEAANIARITAHSEKAAAYMADGYARISHRPGIAMAQSVGAANLAAGIQDAFLAHSPVIALTGRKPADVRHRNAYQEIDHGPVFGPVTKFSSSIETGRQLPFLLRRSFNEALSGPPRPVHLDIAGYTGEITEEEEIRETVKQTAYTSYPAHRTIPVDSAIRSAVNLLKKAQRPALVFGRGAVASDAGAEIAALSELLQIPLAFSCHGKGLIPDTYELNAGPVGTYSTECANRIVSRADLVVFIGSGAGDQVTLNWTIPSVETKTIQIDICPEEPGRNYPGTLALVGDAKKTVVALVECLSERPHTKNTWAGEARRLITEWNKKIDPLCSSNMVPIRPERLCREIGNALPSDGILVADTGYSAIWTCRMSEISNPEQSYLRAAGSLGWAFPAAIGAQFACPERPVVCFTGDGGLWYHIAELETARRWNLPIVVVVNNNNAYSQVIPGTTQAYGEVRGKEEELYAFEDIDFAKIARDMGCHGIRVEKPEEIAPALKEALENTMEGPPRKKSKTVKPVLIDARTDRSCIPEAAWSPQHGGLKY